VNSALTVAAVHALDPSLAGAVSVIGGAIATAIIQYAAYHWPRGYHRREAVKDRAGGGDTE
jgi:hypothetical protein